MKKQKKEARPIGEDHSFFREIQVEFLIHELKDPIAIIETGARTLLEKKEKYGALTARQEKTLSRVLRNTRKAQEMLQDLLEVGRSEAGGFFCCRFQASKVVYEVLLQALEMKAAEVFEGTRELDREPTCWRFWAARASSSKLTPRSPAPKSCRMKSSFVRLSPI